MISPDERREVAERMRVVADGPYVSTLSFGEMMNSVLTDGAPQPTNYREMFRCLADLIDPTCHPVPSDGGFFTCSECGERIGAVLPAIGAVLMHHCSHCGARVTSGGER